MDMLRGADLQASRKMVMYDKEDGFQAIDGHSVHELFADKIGLTYKLVSRCIFFADRFLFGASDDS